MTLKAAPSIHSCEVRVPVGSSWLDLQSIAALGCCSVGHRALAGTLLDEIGLLEKITPDGRVFEFGVEPVVSPTLARHGQQQQRT